MLNLSTLLADESFKLDGRSIEQQLQAWYDYVALLPFDGTPDGRWRELFFPTGVGDLQRLAELYRSPALSDGQLAPQHAFLLAFLRLLETPRKLLNQLPSLHRQLYYRDLLGLQPRAAQADWVAVSFTLSSDAAEVLMPAQTALDAGQDGQGQALHYLLDQALQVNPGQLHALHWLRSDGAGQKRLLLQEDATPILPPSGTRLFEAHAQEQVVVTGRVVADALLAMSDGVREITIHFTSAPPVGSLGIALSSENGWLVQAEVSMSGTTTTLICVVDADQAAITAPAGLDGFHDSVPLLRMTRQDGLPVEEVVEIEVMITSASSSRIALRTDHGASDWQQPLLPFGAEPRVGASVELVAADWLRRQQAVTLTLTPDWDALPNQGFRAWYAGYPSADAIQSNSVFQASVQAFTAQGWKQLGDNQALFVGGNGAPVGAPITFVFTSLPGRPVDSADPADWTSRLKLTLSGSDFLHQEYWQHIESGVPFDDNGEAILNPPYTPQWRSFSVRYQSRQIITREQQYLLTPFGHQRALTATEQSSEPQLYLGLGGMLAGQQLSLYWKLQGPQPLQLRWEYLTDENRWTSLDAKVFDATGGLFESGLWSAELPGDASDQATWMPQGAHWLRAIVSVPSLVRDEFSESDVTSAYPLLQGLLTNAMTATLANAEQIAADHFGQPLPAGSITQTVARIDGLENVLQPWPAQGGRALELLDAFNLRAQRQLSSRGRALRRGDIKALLLEHFSEVAAVILPEDDGVPGRQIMTIIPAPGQRDNTDAKRPTFNPARLARMRQFLQAHTSMWVDLQLYNPVYIDVIVNYHADFDAAVSEDFGRAQLEAALDLYYLPWAGSAQAVVDIGRRLDYYQLLAFMQQQTSVVKVNDLFVNGETQSITPGRNEVLVLRWGDVEKLPNPSNLKLVPSGEKRLMQEYPMKPAPAL